MSPEQPTVLQPDQVLRASSVAPTNPPGASPRGGICALHSAPHSTPHSPSTPLCTTFTCTLTPLYPVPRICLCNAHARHRQWTPSLVSRHLASLNRRHRRGLPSPARNQALSITPPVPLACSSPTRTLDLFLAGVAHTCCIKECVCVSPPHITMPQSPPTLRDGSAFPFPFTVSQ